MSNGEPYVPWIDQVNFIISWFSQSCSTPWSVFVQTNLPATKRLIISLLAFGWEDVARGYLRPNPKRRGRHGRKGRPGAKRGVRGFIPEIGEIIGKRLPGQQTIASRQVHDTYRSMWRLDTAMQRHNYYWLIVSSFTQWQYDWMHGIVKAEETSCETLPRMLRRSESLTQTSFTGWQPFPAHDIIYEENIIASERHLEVPDGEGVQIVASCQIEPLPGGTGPAIAQIRISAKNGDQEMYDYSSRVELEDGQTADLITYMHVRGPALVEWDILRGNGLKNFRMLNVEVEAVGGY